MDFDSYFKREGRAKKFYPVIHVADMTQAETNAKTAFKQGADGIFLINHQINSDMLLLIAAVLRGQWPGRFIGVNLLDESTGLALERASRPDRALNAIWADDSGIDDAVSFRAKLHQVIIEKITWPGYYFACVAFKYQASVADVGLAARNAISLAHVVVTSGDETGSPPTVEKIKTMKEAIGDHPLAIASGMAAQNIHRFLPYADIFMVATGISDKDDNLDPRLVNQMATIIKTYNKSAGLL